MDWTKFNNHGESPNHAFEVMCNILFKCWLKKEYKDNISHFAFVNGSGGDGGVDIEAAGVAFRAILGIDELAHHFGYMAAMHLVIPEAGARGRLRAKTPLKAMLMGGEPLDGPRHLWWNFVSSSKERIEQAKDDWREGHFGTIPGDAEEFIPLPPF